MGIYIQPLERKLAKSKVKGRSPKFATTLTPGPRITVGSQFLAQKEENGE
jgi:hypothetical protein